MRHDAAWLRHVFDRQLPLAGLAAREEQAAVAGYVHTALEKGRHLLAEAGVGTGKTYAYLVPLLAYMQDRQAPALIATHTIALQEQLVERDIPAVSRLLALPAPVLLAKGREHYLCKARLGRFRDGHARPSAEEASLLDWGQRTMSGDRAQAPPVSDALWSQVNWGPLGPCARTCRQAATCPAAAVRRRWQTTEGLVVTNHQQLMADVVARAAGRSIFTLPGAVVVDEAHALAEAARQVLGSRLDLKSLARGAADALAQAGPGVNQGAAWLAAMRELEACLPARIRWNEDEEAERHAIALDETLERAARRAVEGATVVLAQLDRLDARPARVEAAERLARMLPALQALLATDRHVSWVEGDGAQRRSVALASAPLDVGAILRDRLWNRPAPAILVSATLAAGEDFTPTRRELGLEAPPLVCLAGSPFDYERQCRLYLPTDLPDPGVDADRFYSAAHERLLALITATRGRALVLFTSRRRAANAHAALRERARVPVMLQDRARPEVLARFVAEPAAVLLATGYWTGLDVPGETLSCVAIVKLPFAPPDPVLDARMAAARRGGLDPHEAVLVPEMLIRLKQGAGRAIRRESDRAVVAVLDPRASAERFAEEVAASLPPAPHVTALAEVTAFLDGDA